MTKGKIETRYMLITDMHYLYGDNKKDFVANLKNRIGEKGLLKDVPSVICGLELTVSEYLQDIKVLSRKELGDMLPKPKVNKKPKTVAIAKPKVNSKAKPIVKPAAKKTPLKIKIKKQIDKTLKKQDKRVKGKVNSKAKSKK